MTIDVEQHRPHIEGLLATLGQGEFTLKLVDSVEQWAESVNLPNPGPFRAAMAATTGDGTRLIVVRRFLTDDIQRGVLDGFLFRGFGSPKALEDPTRFVEHLTLHEAAHHILDTREEAPCDNWAFARLSADERAV